MKIKLYDNTFAHHAPGSSISSFPGHDVFSKHIEWIRDPNVECDYAFFTDDCVSLVDKHPHKYNFAWMIEPKELVPTGYKQISDPNFYIKFDKILTHDSELLKLDPEKFIYANLYGCWVKPEDQKIHPKTKNICIIVSNKRQLEGHKLRHEIVEKLSDKYKIDVWGNGYKPFSYLGDILKDYRFCVVVENTPGFITEKTISPLRCGCQVIGWQNDKKFSASLDWNILNFNDIESLERLIDCDKPGKVGFASWYENITNMGVIKNNFDKTEIFTCLEDWIYINILQPWMKTID